MADQLLAPSARKFTGSGHCKSRVHCIACRTERVWRESLYKEGLAEAIDFECPNGVTAITAHLEQGEAFNKMRSGLGMQSTMRQVRQGKGTCCGSKQEVENAEFSGSA